MTEETAKLREADIDRALDDSPLGAVQWRIILLCAVVAMIDGYDTQAIAFVAPVLSEDWGISPDRFGLIFSAGLLGIMVGQFTLGPLADRFGRRPVIIACTIIFGVGSFATAVAPDWIALLALRFCTGIGLGGATPNVISLTSEYSPSRARATIITSMFAGFPFGAAIGGYISSQMIPALGWQSVFVAGGLIPVVLLPLLFLWLKESPYFLATREEWNARLARLMESVVGRRVDAGQVPESSAAAVTAPERGGYASLFSGGRTGMTLALWIAYFNSLLLIYFLMSWLPVTARESGLALDTAIVSAVFLNLGGAIGGIFLGRLSDKWGAFKVLAIGYATAGLAIALIGQAGSAAGLLMVFVFVAGLFTIGGQTAMNAAVTMLYPAQSRATGLGAALAVGRIGSIVGPTVGGLLLASDWSLAAIFAVVAVPAFVTALVAILLVRLLRPAPAMPATA